MQHVGAHFGRLHDADLGVHIGAVHIHLAAVFMDDAADVADAFFIHAVGGRVGNHQRAQRIFILFGLGFQVGNIHVAVLVGIHDHNLHTGHVGGGGVGAVGGARNQAHVAFGVALRFVVAADGHHAGVFALRAGVGLDTDGVKAGNGLELLLQAVDHFQAALHLFARGKRVHVGEFRPGNRNHLGGGIQLHGAGTERNHAAVHGQVALFQFFQVAQHFVFGVVAVEHGVLQDRAFALQVFR